MRVDDGLDQAEAEAEAAFGPAPVAPEEPIPDPRLLLRRDADAGVSHANVRQPSLAETETSIRPPEGVNFTALSIRLAATCSSRGRSPRNDERVTRLRMLQRDALGIRHVRIQRHRALQDVVADRPADAAAAASRSRPRRCPSACSASPASDRFPRRTRRALRGICSTSAGESERQFGGAAQPRQRRAQIVRDVVERARMASTRRAMRSSIALNSTVSSSIASPSPDASASGTRASVRPVRMIWRTVCVRRRIGDSADCVAIQPPTERDCDDEQRHDSQDHAEPREQRLPRFAALSHLTSVPSPSCADSNSTSRGSQPSGLLRTFDLDAAIDHADKQPFRRRRLLGLNRSVREPNPPRTYAAAYSPTLLRRI